MFDCYEQNTQFISGTSHEDALWMRHGLLFIKLLQRWYPWKISAIPTMAEKCSKFVLVKELQIYTTWPMASFQILILEYILGAIFSKERFETQAKAKGKSSWKELHGLQCSWRKMTSKKYLLNPKQKVSKQRKRLMKKQFKETLPYINNC